MTVALCVKVHDGVVLAADSAATLASAEGIVNVYDNANKLCNLYKGLPIGMATYGAGNIGLASISTLMKDLRARFVAPDGDGGLDPSGYRIEDVVKSVRTFYYNEKYLPEFHGVDPEDQPALGLMVSGYSAGAHLPETWSITIERGACDQPELTQGQDEAGIFWRGEIEAIHRLVWGHSLLLPKALQRLGADEQAIPDMIDVVRSETQVGLWSPAMPIQDAIDLAEFLVYLTEMYSRFKEGAPTVGGPIEIAAITKHEGFKWIKRKYYYDRHLNPEA